MEKKYSEFLKLIFRRTVIAFLLSSIISYLLHLINPIEYNGFSSENAWIEIFVAFIFAPLIETVIFFFLTYKIINAINFLKYKKNLYILFSSITFGLSHYYNINYIIETSITGLFMADLFYTLEKKSRFGFTGVFLMHGIYNIFVFILNLLL
ncbi:CPBP family glutamic-type intramembrane protease [Chryseobacterium fluminis]|uniref:CPBP family glutamic-type intramembrane protease n=1 Tax=Chryseobacterium fluminis TaxID=2983606 RepID=UPI002253F9E4|nr:CPBP family glutamic-type intramembrane protease [Chryseobacterium sp. MMS21-Ot14]UZT97514.1 CPBP family glutamic-type intramembrane protease [Chryseobacterium sp. MMS21-Ot14]